jgi:hypothetical protein
LSDDNIILLLNCWGNSAVNESLSLIVVEITVVFLLSPREEDEKRGIQALYIDVGGIILFN